MKSGMDSGLLVRERLAPLPITRPPLRFGVMIDRFLQPAWVDFVLADIFAAGIAIPAVVILNDHNQVQTNGVHLPARVRAWIRNWRSLPYTAYSRLDRRRYASVRDPFHVVDISSWFAGCPLVRVAAVQTTYDDYFADAVVEEIYGYELDVIWRLGFRILKGRCLEMARYGVWSFHHADNVLNRGGPPGFWEVAHGHQTTGAVLQRLTEELDGGHVLGRSYARTVFSSVVANCENYFWDAAALLPRELRRVREGGHDNATVAPERHYSSYSRPLYKVPSPMETVRTAIFVGARLLAGKFNKVVQQQQWALAYSIRRPYPERQNVPDGVMHRFKPLVPPRDRNWADPFPVVHEGRRYVFFEEELISTSKGHISIIEIDAKGLPGPVTRVLERDYHLSYPNVFNWQGEWYMIPETLSRNAVELFKATRFPIDWDYLGPLVPDLAATDATVAEIDNTWWLFAGVVLAGSQDATALYLYHASSPLGPWSPHAFNPVKIDVRSVRPAGRLFAMGDALYRPAQDGTPVYGSAINIHRIDEISPTQFRETLVSRIEPLWRPRLSGVHTINAAADLTVIDFRHTIPRWPGARDSDAKLEKASGVRNSSPTRWW